MFYGEWRVLLEHGSFLSNVAFLHDKFAKILASMLRHLNV
jgi:hypothetical protein